MLQTIEETDRYRLWPGVNNKPLSEFEEDLAKLGFKTPEKTADSYEGSYLCRKYNLDGNCSGISITYLAMTRSEIVRGVRILINANSEEDEKIIIGRLVTIGKLERLSREQAMRDNNLKRI